MRTSVQRGLKALDTFDTGKTPGNDGIPAEFYKIFWNSIGIKIVLDSGSLRSEGRALDFSSRIQLKKIRRMFSS